jgi:ornithine carbamoyltransferase
MAAQDADVIYTDVWASMGKESEMEERIRHFQKLQVNQNILDKARSNAIVLHCMPAHRNLEITDEVMDGPRSVVIDEAENRLHAQKALLALIMS